MKWTKEIPKVPGLYWIKVLTRSYFFDTHPCGGEIEEADQIVAFFDGEDTIFQINQCEGFAFDEEQYGRKMIDEIIEWSDKPIEYPEEYSDDSEGGHI